MVLNEFILHSSLISFLPQEVTDLFKAIIQSVWAELQATARRTSHSKQRIVLESTEHILMAAEESFIPLKLVHIRRPYPKLQKLKSNNAW